MPNQLEFMDCPHCGKRVATTAPTCRHCNKSPQMPGPSRSLARDESGSNTSHMAADSGGYDESENDFNYEDFVAEEFGDTATRRKPWWWYTTWLMIVVFSLPIILQLFGLVRI